MPTMKKTKPIEGTDRSRAADSCFDTQFIHGGLGSNGFLPRASSGWKSDPKDICKKSFGSVPVCLEDDLPGYMTDKTKLQYSELQSDHSNLTVNKIKICGNKEEFTGIQIFVSDGRHGESLGKFGNSGAADIPCNDWYL